MHGALLMVSSGASDLHGVVEEGYVNVVTNYFGQPYSKGLAKEV